MRDTTSNDASLGITPTGFLFFVQLQREAALDHVAGCTECTHALTVDDDLNAARVSDPQACDLSAELAVRSGRKRTLHANIAVNRHPKPGGGREAHLQVRRSGCPR